MATTSMFNLYSTWDKFEAKDEAKDHIAFDDDKSVALASYRRLDSNPFGDAAKLGKSQTFVLSPKSVRQSNAVEVKHLTHSYGSGRKVVHTLRNVTLNVPSGQIYGLLGPSGCGKTTLLRHVVGLLEPQSGYVRVYGRRPGEPGAPVPGPLIGYMPQELALFPDFTIRETLIFFAQLFGMQRKAIKERVRFLVNFLELPDKNRLVGNLSGGQKRRVSLAVALVHSPPLLILDEPTVGVDPVLRQTIWNYLVTLTQTTQLTVIITTHYIEEARAAQTVGLMRFGRVLCEASPDYLMQRFAMNTLESVFLKLCEMDAMLNGTGTPTGGEGSAKGLDLDAVDDAKPDIVSANNADEPEVVLVSQGRQLLSAIESPNEMLNASDVIPPEVDKSKTCAITSFSKTNALFKKNLIRLRRNLPVLLFQFLLPSIEVILFCICIGQDPFNIPVAVYNQEIPSTGHYGDMFLHEINNSTINLIRYDSRAGAMDAVKKGDAWGAIVIGQNFSTALQLRVLMAGGADNDTLDQSNVNVHLDMTNQIIGYELQRTLLSAWQSFSDALSLKMGQNPQAFEFPVKFDQPIYGGKDPSFTEFMAPGVLLSIAFLAAVALTALAFVMERKEGLLERSLVAGVSSYEFLFSHVLTQLLVLSVQIALLLVFTFLVFGIPSSGHFVWVILLTLLQGSCGMAYGLMISALCKEENSATMLALGSFYPNLLLSGTVWPVQAMPDFMRYFSYVLPQTIPIESMRYILSRGWGPEQLEVGLGFVITILWTSFFLVAAVIIFKIKK